MKNFQVFLILISTISCIQQLRGDEIDDDVANVKSILEVLKTDQGFVWRKVYDNGQELSIINNIDSNKLLGEIDIQTITRENVYAISHLTSIVLSCDYGGTVYSYIKIIEKCFSECIDTLSKISSDTAKNENDKLQAMNQCFTTFHTMILDKILQQTPQMILALSAFAKFTRNYVSKYHDIVKILLSWYVFIVQRSKTKNDDVKNYEKSMSLLESIEITNSQMKHRLERFLVRYCNAPAYPTDFIRQANMEVKNLNNAMQYQRVLGIKNFRLTKLTFSSVKDVRGNFVINTDKDFTTLITILTDQASSKKIQIQWENNDDLKEVFDLHIVNSIDIEKILQYEKILLNVACDIISRYSKNVINQFIRTTNVTKKHGDCINLFKQINEFSAKLKNGNHSVILTTYLIRVKNDLSDLCSLIQLNQDINGQIKKMMNEYAITSVKNESDLTSSTEIEGFLNKLSEISICAKLHPSISNTFWKKYNVYSPTEIQKYGINYQRLYTVYDKKMKKKNLCELIMRVSTSLNNIEELINRSITKDSNYDYVPSKGFDFKPFNENLNKIITDVATITMSTRTHFDDWANMLLTLYYNKKNIELFDDTKQQSLDFIGRSNLVVFIFDMKSLLLENQHVECKCGVLSDVIRPDDCSGDDSWDPEPALEQSSGNVEDLISLEKIKKIFLFEQTFRSIPKSFKNLLSKNFEMTTPFKMYWDGAAKQLPDLLTIYDKSTFDLQDAYDYGNFFIKWAIAIMNTKFIRILSLSIELSSQIKEDDLQQLQKCVNTFLGSKLMQTLDSIQFSSVKRHLMYSTGIISLFNPKDNKSVSATRTVIDALSSYSQLIDLAPNQKMVDSNSSVFSYVQDLFHLTTFFEAYIH